MARTLKSVKVVSYPKLFFVWPLIIAPGIMMVLESAGVSNEGQGWVYLSLCALVLLTLGIDLDRTTAFVCLILGVCGFLFVRVLATEFQFYLWPDAFEFLDRLNVGYDPGFAIALSIVLLTGFLFMFFWVRIHNRWEITPHEFKHSSFGVVDKSLARGAKAIKTSYPDLLEVFLGFSGTLHVYSANGDQELASIPHIPFLPLVKLKIKTVLEGTATQGAQAEEEEVAKG